MSELIFDLVLPAIDWTGVPKKFRWRYEGKVSAVVRSAAEAEDLVRYFRRADFCPLLPVFVNVPTGQPVLIEGLGVATAAELRDIAVEKWARSAAMTGPVFDFDALRERAGLPERGDVDQQTRQALWDTAQDLKRRQRTALAAGELEEEYPNFERRSHVVSAENSGVTE